VTYEFPPDSFGDLPFTGHRVKRFSQKTGHKPCSSVRRLVRGIFPTNASLERLVYGLAHANCASLLRRILKTGGVPNDVRL
jgi:hypothetical protein